MTLKDRVAVVTGGSSGIGLAAARALAEDGAKVYVFGRQQAALDTAVGSLGKAAFAVQGNVTQGADLQRLYGKTGRIDVLVINAAIVKLCSISDTSDAFFDEIVSTNMKGAFNTLKYALPVLNDGASVIFTTSWLNRIGFAGSSVTSMTKAAVRSLVRVAAAELAPRHIRVNAISPGAIETPLWGKLDLPADALRAAGAAITEQIPLKRWGTADEIGKVIRFLASPEASYINGTELEVDGGMRQV